MSCSLELSHSDAHSPYFGECNARLPHVLKRIFRGVPHGFPKGDWFHVLFRFKFRERLKPFDILHILDRNHAFKNVRLQACTTELLRRTVWLWEYTFILA